MATAAQWRKAALALPEAEEKSHFDQPDFRVRNKIFAGLSTDGTRGNLKLPPEVQAIVLQESSGAFTPAAGAWGRSGWTYVELAKIATAALPELLREAWSIVAPPSLVAEPRAKMKRAAKPIAKAKAKTTTKRR